MFDIGWAEFVVIGVVALIVIGPEDLPEMFRTIGRFTGKLRQMGREFQRAMDQAAKDTGVKDVANDLKATMSPKAMGLEAMKSAADKFEKWDPIKNAAKPATVAAATSSAKGEAAADAADAALSANRDIALAAMSAPPSGTPTALTVPSSLTSVAAQTAAEKSANDKVSESSILGPATKALRDKQAARAAVLAESAAKLKAIDEGTYPPPVEDKPKRKPRAAAAAAVEAPPAKARAKKPADFGVAAVVAKAKAPRKTPSNKADQA